jgi:hypothetical protein
MPNDYDPSMYAHTGCMVLKIVEIESTTGDSDNTVYILYDVKTKEFVVRGQRNRSYKTEFEPYAFRCKDITTLLDFVSLSICSYNSISYTLYNCADLPYLSDDISFDSLEWSCYKANEITGYDNMPHSRKMMKKYVYIVKNMFNSY